jgi:alpha-L-fucosidase
LKRKVTLDGITSWMQVNSEGIYATRPWKIYGEGPSTTTKIVTGNFNEDKQKDLTSEDIRFTAKGNTIYAFVMGWPAKEFAVNALGLASDQAPGAIRNVELLGYNGKLGWKQDEPACASACQPKNSPTSASRSKSIWRRRRPQSQKGSPG